MGEKTKIEYADGTFNPWSGCHRKSPGCRNCFAAAWAKRFLGDKVEWVKGGKRLLASAASWKGPVRWNAKAAGGPWLCPQCRAPEYIPGPKTRGLAALCHKCGFAGAGWTPPRERVLVPGCDPFEEGIPQAWFERFLLLIQDTPNLDWLLLTKRPENIRSALALPPHPGLNYDAVQMAAMWLDGLPPKNVWLGVSVENNDYLDRLDDLFKTAAAHYWLSAEPLLGPVDLAPYLAGRFTCRNCGERKSGNWCHECERETERRSSLDWVVVGGETGPGAAPCCIEWVRALVKQCREARVPCYVKQLGCNVVDAEGNRLRFKSRRANDPSEWPEDLRVREFPKA